MNEYKYITDSQTKYRTVLHFIAFAAVAIALLLLFDGGYILAWFISTVVAIFALMVLSIPRKLIVGETGIDICCISDYTYIPYSEIASVKAVDNKTMKWMLPIFAASGFFGYYGCYLDLKNMDFVKVYASKWSNFVEITDIYEDKYYISCDNESELIESVEQRVAKIESNE